MSTERTPNWLEGFPTRMHVAIMGGVSILLAILFVLTLYNSRVKPEYEEPPNAVTLLFDSIIQNYGSAQKQRTNLKLALDYSGYSLQSEADEVVEEDLSNFLSVLTPRAGEAVAASYEVNKALEGYIELTLKDKDGNSIYPRVSMRYEMTPDNRYITTYTIGRLSPFSRYDEEYSELWK